MPCNCGGSGQWQPPAEGAGQQAAVTAALTGPGAPGYFAEPTPEPPVWNGPEPAPSKPEA
jgi:hypothetical protein